MDEAVILEKIKALYKRLRLKTYFSLLSRCLLVSLVSASIYLTFIKLTGFFKNYTNYAFVFPIVGIAASIVIHYFDKVSLMDAALISDSKLELKERLSTALEWILDKRLRTPMFRALIKDTAQASQSVKPKEVFPLDFTGFLKKSLSGAAILTLCFWMPSLSLFVKGIPPETVQALKTEALKIEQELKKLDKIKPITPAAQESLKKTEKSLQELLKDLKTPEADKREALASISKAEESINKEQEIRKALEKQEKDLKSAQKNRTGVENDSKNSMESMAEKLKELAEKLKDENLTEEEKKQITSELEELAEMMKDAHMDTDSLQKALESLNNGDAMQASQELSRMSETLMDQSMYLEETVFLNDAAQQLAESRSNISGQPYPVRERQMQAFSQEAEGEHPADFGTGSTNEEEKSEESSEVYTHRHSDEKPHMRGLYESMYKPERDEFSSAAVKEKGTISQGPRIRSLLSEQRGAPIPEGMVRQEPADVYANYKVRGEEALRRQNIPAEYRELIRNYYDDINPEK